MLNHVFLVGRLVQTPILQITESGRKMSMVTLAVNRTYKNPNGEYDTDFFDCTLWTNIAENTAEYCKTGDVIGVRGRLQTRLVEKEDGSKYKKMDIIAEKVTFLSSSKTNKNIEEIEEDTDVDSGNSIEKDIKNDKVCKKKK